MGKEPSYRFIPEDTFMQKTSERGRVMITKKALNTVSISAHGPGPVGSAERHVLDISLGKLNKKLSRAS